MGRWRLDGEKEKERFRHLVMGADISRGAFKKAGEEELIVFQETWKKLGKK